MSETTDETQTQPIGLHRHSSTELTGPQIWAWGGNTTGKLGFGKLTGVLNQMMGQNVDIRPRPARFPHLRDLKVVSIACGLNHTLFLTVDGTVWGLGMTALDFEGHSASTTPGTAPKEVTFFHEFNASIYMIAAGSNHSLALDSTGAVYKWGQSADKNSVKLQGLEGKNVAHFAGGGTHSLFLTDKGEVYAEGDNSSYQCGTTATSIYNGAVRQLATTYFTKGKVIGVACGSLHSCAWTDRGAIYVWGYCLSLGYKRKGNQRWHNEPNPTLVESLWHKKKFVTQVIANPSSNHSFAITREGELYGWGMAYQFQLGTARYSSGSSVKKISALTQTGKKVVAAASTQFGGAAVLNTGELWTWGSNASGELGIGSFDQQPKLPAPVQAITDHQSPLVSIVAGQDYYFATTFPLVH